MKTKKTAAAISAAATPADPATTDTTSENTTVQDTTSENTVALTLAPIVDPFAELPTISVGDYSLTDLSTVATADPRKYTSVQESAIKAKSQIKPGWKNAAAMLAVGPHDPESMKPTSVMGMIRNKVASYGRAGVPAYVIVDYLRREARDNKRSHFCGGKLPPIGWAEGYIDGAISKKLIKVLEGKVAPALPSEVTQDDGAEAEVQEDAKTGTNG